MASQKGGGVGFGLLIGLIFAIFIIIGLIYLSITNNSAYHAEVALVKQAKEDAAQAEEKLKKIERVLAETNMLISGSVTQIDNEKVTRDYISESGKKLKETLDLEAISSEQFVKDLDKNGKLQPKQYKYLLEVYQDLFIQLAAAIPELNLLRTGKAAIAAELETVRQTGRKEKSEVETALAKEREEKSALNAKLLDDAKNFDADKRRLIEEKETIQKESSKQQEDRLMVEARLESEIKRLESRIHELTEKRKKTLADTEQDGEIVHADQRLGLGWINLGQKNRLRRGTVFDVFQYVKGGVKKMKGKIEIKSLEEETAQVAIISQTDPSDPIVKGDFVSSPFYDTRKGMVFVFVGEKMSKLSRYSMDELSRRIEETGGRVDKSVTIDSDFIIAIENAEQSDEFTRAVQFGVTIMREAELLEYLGR